MRKLLANALEQLNPIDKTVTVLSDLEGLSAKEIATAVGLTVSAVKSRLHRARLYLRGRVFQARLNGNSSSVVKAINHEYNGKRSCHLYNGIYYGGVQRNIFYVNGLFMLSVPLVWYGCVPGVIDTIQMGERNGRS
jgi:Sigma-70, region 4